MSRRSVQRACPLFFVLRGEYGKPDSGPLSSAPARSTTLDNRDEVLHITPTRNRCSYIGENLRCSSARILQTNAAYSFAKLKSRSQFPLYPIAPCCTISNKTNDNRGLLNNRSNLLLDVRATGAINYLSK